MLYRGKELIYSEKELIIYQLKWYNSASIISLSLWVFRPKLVFYDRRPSELFCLGFWFFVASL